MFRLTVSFVCIVTYINLICRCSLKDVILEGGIPFNKAHDGLNVFEYLEKNKGLGELFSQSMAKSIAPSMTTLLEKYNGFEGMKKVVDVGGGHGASLSCIISKYAHLKGINFDLPHVVQLKCTCTARYLANYHFLLIPSVSKKQIELHLNN